MPALSHALQHMRAMTDKRHYRATVVDFFCNRALKQLFVFSNFLYLLSYFIIVCPHLYATNKNVTVSLINILLDFGTNYGYDVFRRKRLRTGTKKQRL